MSFVVSSAVLVMHVEMVYSVGMWTLAEHVYFRQSMHRTCDCWVNDVLEEQSFGVHTALVMTDEAHYLPWFKSRCLHPGGSSTGSYLLALRLKAPHCEVLSERVRPQPNSD